MIAILSPSKTLDFERDLKTPKPTVPALLLESKKLIPELKALSEPKLQKLMSISPKLAALNYERFQKWATSPRPKGARPALSAFRGDVYEGFPLEEYSQQDFTRAQKTLRILSGLYGVLRPLDLIQPYRLEMKTSLKNVRGKDLYSFWGTLITKELQRSIEESKSKVLINLASQEYAKAVKFSELSVPVVTVDFKEDQKGTLKSIALFAKQARGYMANFIVTEKVTTLSDLKSFNVSGYRHLPSKSTDEKWLFVRKR
ncbi:MAG: peroxide stress protein YaaA [Bdellovibrionales bacterium]|nr:peroxide stress protein YaaA [Bdellovibrionales bacterium]